MIRVSNDYWNDLLDQEIGAKPIDKVEMELSAGVWTDITDKYLGGATFDQEKERAPDKISAGDTRYSFDNTEDTFTPSVATSIFYGVTYIGKKIRYSVGYEGIGYYTQSVMLIKDVDWDLDEQLCYISAQESMQRLIDEKLNTYNTSIVPTPGATNVGNGTCSNISVKPLSTVSENWTLTCTLGGADATATFSVTGSVTGLVGTATSGTEFSTGNKVKFTISGGGTNWVIADSFTFTTRQFPEWSSVNPGKIIWSILTGYGWDSGTQDAWSAAVMSFDHTKSDDNTDLNYDSFVRSIANIDNNLTGYIPYDKPAAEAIEEIILHFLGSIYTDNKGRISLYAYKPGFEISLLREFADTKKVYTLDFRKSSTKIINYVSVSCKKTSTWAWDDTAETIDDLYVAQNSTSITAYGMKQPLTFTDRWYSGNHAAQKWFADRLVDKYGNPPTEIEFETGLDAIKITLGKQFTFTDARTSLSNQLMEAMVIKKDFEAAPKVITIVGHDSNVFGIGWMFYGSSANESDGISPQNADYDSATDSDKQFGYYSTTGSAVNPLYYYF